jgi:acetyl esterase/lipase
MDRRTLLALTLLGASVAPVLAACGETGPVDDSPEPGTKTITYGDDPSQFAELTLPATEPRGVVVVIHGGFWRAEYGIEYARPLVSSLVAAGWAAYAIEYRRVGNGGGTPETFDDVAAAIDALSEQDTDTSTVIAIGHSAGGHLAVWAAGRTDPTVAVTAAVSQAGVLDLVDASRSGLGGGAADALLGRPASGADAEWDPFQQIPLAVPVICVHGTGDDIVPIEQSRTYVAAAGAAGADAELVELDGDHFVVIDPTSAAWATQLDLLDRFG